MEMFCRQCEQTARGQGCTVKGVCGKEPLVADEQDILIHVLKGIGFWGMQARGLGVSDVEVDCFVKQALFTTVTNVNFDPEKIQELIERAVGVRADIQEKFLKAYKNKNGKEFSGETPDAVNLQPAKDNAGIEKQIEQAGILADDGLDEDIRSLREILLYGLKGMAAYADHACLLGAKDEVVDAFFYKGLASLADNSLGAEQYLGLIMEFGQANLKCMEILDKAHNAHFGSPEPTNVYWGVKKGPAIIVSGHDLPDIEELLKQTEGKGVNIYTHGEMLPAHGYPQLKKYKHLAGHFGTAWQNQQKEFNGISAVVLMTTNCIQKPLDSYKDRIFTTGLVAWPGVEHITAQANGKKDFSPLIKKALSLGGFKDEKKEREVTVGFAHTTVTSVAGKVLDLVAQKKIRHFFLIGGCDGAKPGRNYYSELAERIPEDCLILTLACGKFRINERDYGAIEGIPRLLDCGQCNDAYSAIKIASALAAALGCGVNDLPLSLVLSWYEQKAVCILLTLLSLGIKNIRLGPSLPAFVSPNVLNILVEKFQIQPIKTAEEDLNAILGLEKA